MPWIVYETTNTVNGKRYIGVHKQDGDEFDGYLGSGKYLANAIAKYGRENFARRTMFSFESEQDAYAREAEIVTEEWCKRKDSYNMKPGGFGGFPNNDPEFKERTAARMKALHSDPEFKERASARMKALHSEPEFKERTSARMKALNSDPEFKERISARMKALHSDPEFKERTAARMKALNSDPEFRKRNSAATKAYWVRCRISKANALLAIICQ